jgi:hypothetical protein
MVGGMLGTLIGVERAVALDQRWAFLAPVVSGVGGLAALAGADWRLVTSAFVVAGVLFVAVNVLIVLRQLATFTLIMLVGAAAWAAGNIAWALSVPVARLVWLWAAFLVLTIAAERLELSRLRSPPAFAVRLLVVLVVAFSAGALLAVFSPRLGAQVTGASLVVLTAWLMRYDVARKTLSIPGLPRYAAASVLLGYVWLAVAGAMLALFAPLVAGRIYDAVLHALFLGFAFSMVFGHAPIILPAVLRVELPFRRLLYLPLLLLHGSVAIRVAGSFLAWDELRRAGGALNVMALAVFALSVLWSKRARAAK